MTSEPKQSDPQSSATSRAVWIVLAVVGLVIACLTHDAPGSWADASRLAAIESLAERGTLAIDDSTYFWQGDKVWFEPHYYSHQPPMLAILGAVPYGLLHHGLGLDIDSDWTYRLLSIALTGVPVWLGLWALGRLARRAGARPLPSAICVAIAALATILLPYSVVLNQHGTAAGLVLLAIAAVDARRSATAGLLLALAATIDMTAMFPALAMCWPVIANGGLKGLLKYVGGAILPLAVHCAVNLHVAGDLVPFSLHREAFEYPMSPFLLSSLTGVDQPLLSLERAVYVWGSTFGASGLFSHHPILLAAIVCGCLLPFVRRADASADGLSRGVLGATALGSAGIAAFYLTSSNNYSGSAFGMRWFAVFAPVLLLFPAALFGRLTAAGRPSVPGPGLSATLAVLALWSSAAALLGVVNPWAKFHYRWQDSPVGRVAGPDTPVPTLREHWEAEWARIHNRPVIDREQYDLTYQRMLDQHRRLYLRPTPWLDSEQRTEWLDEGLAKLQTVVDWLDRDETPVFSRPAGHFWLGKFHAERGQWGLARREYETAASLAPNWRDPAVALQNLGPRGLNAGG
ncbi:MAG: hypothetical protein ACYSWX_09015 [Planctomycetota bacterium]|jgi:hypothetical protein